MTRWRTAAGAFLLVTLCVTAAGPAGAVVDADGWDRRALPPTADAQVIVGNFGGDEAADIVWYRPGPARDAVWYGRVGVRGQSNMVKRSLSISGTYQPIVGNFAGASDYDEIFWYAPGSTQDYLWKSVPGDYEFGSRSLPQQVSGNFSWAVLEDNRGGEDDIAWIAKGDARDYIWHFGQIGDGYALNKTVSAEGPYDLIAGDFDGNGYDDLFLYSPGTKREELWRSSPQGTVSRTIFEIDRRFALTTIRQSGGDDLFFRTNGPEPERLWLYSSPPFTSRQFVETTPNEGSATAVSFGQGRTLLWGSETLEYVLAVDGTITSYEPLAGPGHDTGTQRPAIGDFDADGHLDILWTGSADPDVFWYAPTP